MKRNPGMRLDEKSIEQLKELAEKNKRSMANMVEILIQNEYEKENKCMDKPKSFLETMAQHQKEWCKVTTYFESKSYPNEVIFGSTVYRFFHDEKDAIVFEEKQRKDWLEKENIAKYKANCELKSHIEFVPLDYRVVCGTAFNKDNEKLNTDRYLEKNPEQNWSLKNVKYFEHY